MPITDPTPMRLTLTDSPWQHLPEMAADYPAERAGIEAGLRLVEIFHSHYALLFKVMGNNQACTLRLGAAVCAARLRADIVGVMR